MNKYRNVKITILGHACSGKSTYACLIGKALGDADIPFEIREHDGSDSRLVLSTNRARLKSLSDAFKNDGGKVIIEVKQAKRTENIV